MAARTRGQGRTALLLAGVVVGMAGLSFAAVPLYDLFCRVTGYGGTTQVDRTGGAARPVLDRTITIRFNADVNPALPWSFQPVERTIDLRVGENALAFYRAENLAQTTTTGSATFNVTPDKAGQYFVKLDCFCFTEQTLAPGQVADMGVTFYVDPAIAEDRNLDDVTTITLSYSFFRAAGDGMTQSSALASPDSGSYN
ncbi:MAG: cytochrome c oxidase assembly protein [Alphaproteobacteria bacterium]